MADNMNPYTLVLSAGTCAGLEYGLYFMQRTAEQAKKKGYTAILTDGTPQSIINAIKATDTPIYYGVGHGACCAYTVQCTQMFLQAGPYTCPPIYICGTPYTYRCLTSMNLDLMRGRHVHLLSCDTGLYLGQELVYRHGARSYIGYKDLFVYGVCVPKTEEKCGGECQYYPQPGEPPNELADFYTFMDSDAAGEEAILNMGTVQDAVNAIIAKMKSYIWKYTYGEWKDWPNASEAALCHIHNLNALVAYGDMNWRPILCASATSTMSELAASFLAPFSLMFGVVGLATLPAPPKPPKVEAAKK
jgi:hypothetical protein